MTRLWGLTTRAKNPPFEITADYSPDQPRDKNGRWTGGGLTNIGEYGNIKSSVNISATGYNKFKQGFTEKNLERHIKKHGQKDYPDFTKEDYNNYTLDLIQQPVSDDILGYKTKDGAVVRYRVSTNDFVKGYPQTGIATMYKPKGNLEKGLKYFSKKKKEEEI